MSASAAKMKLWNLLGVLVVLAAVRPLRCSHISLIGALQPTKGADSYAGGGDTSTAGATSASATANEATAGAEPATRAATEPAATKAATAAASAGTKKATPVNPGPTAASPWDHAELWAQHGTCEYLYVSGQRQDGPNWMSHRDARKGERRAHLLLPRVCTHAPTPRARNPPACRVSLLRHADAGAGSNPTARGSRQPIGVRPGADFRASPASWKKGHSRATPQGLFCHAPCTVRALIAGCLVTLSTRLQPRAPQPRRMRAPPLRRVPGSD